MCTIKLKNTWELDGIKKPRSNIAHEKEVHAQTEQVKNNNKDHENVIDKEQFKKLTARIYIVIFRALIRVLLGHTSI